MDNSYNVVSNGGAGELSYSRCSDTLLRHLKPVDSAFNSRWDVRLNFFLRRVRVSAEYILASHTVHYQVEWRVGESDDGPWELALILDGTELAAFDVWLVFKAEEFF